MESWVDIINDDTGANHDADHIVLPSQQDVEVDKTNPNIRREISYRYEDDNPEKIIRTERTYEIVKMKKKVSNAAILRKKDWVKFGACKHAPKGELERGVTNQRDGHFPFMWNGKNMMPKKRQPKKQKRDRKTAEQLRKLVESQENQTAVNKTGKYQIVQRRADYDDDEKPEIKISNLPQWASFQNIKEMVDQFHRNVLHNMYPPKYRIRMIPSKKTLEEWHANPKEFAHRLAEYERLAIVEFDTEKEVQKAIEVLDGHQYSNHIIRVEKAKRRRF